MVWMYLDKAESLSLDGIEGVIVGYDSIQVMSSQVVVAPSLLLGILESRRVVHIDRHSREVVLLRNMMVDGRI